MQCSGGKVVGLEKIAIMAALNIAHELLQVRLGGGDFDIGTIQRKINNMNEIIDAALLQSSVRCSKRGIKFLFSCGALLQPIL